MVYGRYNYSIHGVFVNQRSHHVWGHHPVHLAVFLFQRPRCNATAPWPGKTQRFPMEISPDLLAEVGISFEVGWFSGRSSSGFQVGFLVKSLVFVASFIFRGSLKLRVFEYQANLGIDK